MNVKATPDRNLRSAVGRLFRHVGCHRLHHKGRGRCICGSGDRSVGDGRHADLVVDEALQDLDLFIDVSVAAGVRDVSLAFLDNKGTDLSVDLADAIADRRMLGRRGRRRGSEGGEGEGNELWGSMGAGRWRSRSDAPA